MITDKEKAQMLTTVKTVFEGVEEYLKFAFNLFEDEKPELKSKLNMELDQFNLLLGVTPKADTNVKTDIKY